MVLKPAGSANTNQHNYSDMRVQADRERQNRRAEPNLQDGRYGFDERAQPLKKKQTSGLYSDTMMVDAPQPRKNQNRRR
jgi:hypothetical protein